MKQIFKSLIAHPGRSIGLLIEVVIVTIIGWIVIEPVAVKTTSALFPAGYDYDRLVSVTFSSLSKASEKFDTLITTDREHLDAAYDILLQKLRERDGVEKATFRYNQSFESGSYARNGINTDSVYSNGKDDISVGIVSIYFKPGTDFFTTYGIKDVNGNPFIEPQNDGKSCIVSQTGAKALSKNGSVIGKKLFDWGQEDENDIKKIIGITADSPYRKGDSRQPVYFEPAGNGYWDQPEGITLRLREGVNVRNFIDKLTAELSDYRSRNIYITHPQAFSDIRNKIFSDKQRELTQKWIIVIFFLVNMLLGIADTFYVQCKSRIPDAGVMRAFGATRRRIEWSIIGEACIVAFIGWLIGSAFYLIYLYHQDFPMETDVQDYVIRQIRPLWHDTKLGRYSIIGGFILLLLLATAAIGAWLPARRVGRVQIVDSLRDE